MANSITDVFAAMQNGVIALGKFQRQLTGSFNNINSQLTTIASSYVISFNARSSVVIPAQGDYPTSLIPGTTTNNNATAGNIGELVASITSTASGSKTYASGVNTDVTSIQISAGDWDLRGTVGTLPSGATSAIITAISTTSATLPADQIGNGSYVVYQLPFTSGARQVCPNGTARISLSSSATIFLVAQLTGSSGVTYGALSARRIR